MNDHVQFEEQKQRNITRQLEDEELANRSIDWILRSNEYQYSYNFSWLGLPIIQYPQDIVAIQELVWQIKPELIIETGVARGGSLILSASILELIGKGLVLGIDVDIRDHNRAAIQEHFLSKRIRLIDGSSTSESTLKHVDDIAQGRNPVLVILDSDHTHDHVRDELAFYSKYVTKGSYLVVMDTTIENAPKGYWPNRKRRWDKDNNPKTAVHEFLTRNDRFIIDQQICGKLLISSALDGYLKCVKE